VKINQGWAFTKWNNFRTAVLTVNFHLVLRKLTVTIDTDAVPNWIITRKPSWRKGYARQRHHSKMAVSRHLEFYRTANSAIRSADPENHNLEPNMEWIGCTVCQIFAFKLYRDLEIGVQGHSKSSKVALFDRAHTTIFVFHSNYAIYYRFRDIATYWSKIATPCISASPLGVKPQIWASTLGDEKLEWWAYQMVKEPRWYVQQFWHNARVWQTDGQTDRQTWHTRLSIYAVGRNNGLLLFEKSRRSSRTNERSLVKCRIAECGKQNAESKTVEMDGG